MHSIRVQYLFTVLFFLVKFTYNEVHNPELWSLHGVLTKNYTCVTQVPIKHIIVAPESFLESLPSLSVPAPCSSRAITSDFFPIAELCLFWFHIYGIV